MAIGLLGAAGLMGGQTLLNWLLGHGAQGQARESGELAMTLAKQEAERKQQLWSMLSPLLSQSMQGAQIPRYQASNPMANQRTVDPAFLQALGSKYNFAVPTTPSVGG
jgi:hypothetical protein